MLITGRESSRILATVGVPRQQSRRVLVAGLAGPAVRTGGALLYDEARVRGLATWSAVDHAELLAACPGGVLVVRLGPGDEPQEGWPWTERARAFRIQPYLGFAAWLQVRAHLQAQARLACVVTVCGYPVLLADLVSFASQTGDEVDQVELGLEPPGDWSRLLQGHRLVTSPGPRWLLLGGQPYLGRAARARERGEPVNAGRSTTWTRWA
ncbi:MAG: hypothetical protein J2P22_14180 [Nocardioides sp.]|nr:hypothetical protein [Nocardioides sp.]